MITVAQCKTQCAIGEDELEFEGWFNQTIPAVVAAVRNAINRPLYDTQASLDAAIAALAVGDTSLTAAMVVTDDLKHAMLMMIGHWFENREASSSLTIKEVPMAFDFLVSPYRCINR